MVKNENIYYLYRHIRLDKNEPFYIGIGKIYKKYLSEHYADGQRYKRAWDFVQRSSLWKKVFSKCNKNIQVEIFLESSDRNFIKQKEIEFVSLYGRINLKTGILTNLTPGGDSPSEEFFSEERKQKLREIKKNIKPSNKFFEESRKANVIKVYQYDLEGNFIKEWECINDAAKALNLHVTNISKCCKEKQISTGGFTWRYFKSEKVKLRLCKNIKTIYTYSLNWDLLNAYESCHEASIDLKMNPVVIKRYALKNKASSNKKCYFSYLPELEIKNLNN
jgi:hypothetical protein